MKKFYLLLFLLNQGFLSIGQEIAPLPVDSGYFPIGVWLQNPSNAASYKKAGINMFIGLWNQLDQPQLDKLKAAGMKVICEQNTFGLNHLADSTIYGWMHQDEPDNAQWNETTQKYDPCIAPNVIINGYNTMKSKDPSRPVYLNLGQGVSFTEWIGRGTCTGKTEMYPVYKNGYLKGCDIGSYDIYPVNNSDPKISGNLWYVPKGIDSLHLWSENKKPIWCWIETTQIDKSSPRKPNPDEVKAQVWMALIHGAKGFGYFCHSWTPSFVEAALLQDANMLAAVTKINTQIISLAAVLNSVTTSNYASVKSSNSKVPIHSLTKADKNANYVFAVSMRSDTTTATFTIASGTVAEVLGENRTISIKSGVFTDKFSGYQVHLYKITSGSTAITEKGIGNGIKIFPNPSSSYFSIQLPSSVNSACTFTLYDLTGRTVYESTDFAEGEMKFHVAGLQQGLYLYMIKNKRGIIASDKIIIE